MAKVFLTQQQHHDTSQAKTFGEIVTVYPPSTQVYGDTPHFVDVARRFLRNADEDDFILPLGDPVLGAILTMVMCEKFGIVNILKFDRKTKSYSSYSIDIEGQPIGA